MTPSKVNRDLKLGDQSRLRLESPGNQCFIASHLLTQPDDQLLGMVKNVNFQPFSGSKTAEKAPKGLPQER